MVYVSEHGFRGLRSKCSHGGRVRKKTRPEDVAEPIEIEIDGELVQIGESELAYYLAGHCGIGFYKSNGRLCFARDPSNTNINHIVATIVIRSPFGLLWNIGPERENSICSTRGSSRYQGSHNNLVDIYDHQVLMLSICG